jgi:hypothetical protein
MKRAQLDIGLAMLVGVLAAVVIEEALQRQFSGEALTRALVVVVLLLLACVVLLMFTPAPTFAPAPRSLAELLRNAPPAFRRPAGLTPFERELVAAGVDMDHLLTTILRRAWDVRPGTLIELDDDSIPESCRRVRSLGAQSVSADQTVLRVEVHSAARTPQALFEATLRRSGDDVIVDVVDLDGGMNLS